MALPIVGAFVFLLLTSEVQDRKKLARFRLGSQAVKDWLRPGADLASLEDADARLQASYMTGTAGALCCGHTSMCYYPGGELFYRALLEDLAQWVTPEGSIWRMNTSMPLKNMDTGRIRQFVWRARQSGGLTALFIANWSMQA